MSVDTTISALERVGYRWGTNSKYWVMWTMWEPDVLDQLYPLSNLEYGPAWGTKVDHFNQIINQGFTSISSDPSFRSLNSSLKMRYFLIQTDLEIDENQAYSPVSEAIELQAIEMVFKGGKFCRFQPIALIACAGLAEVLRSICKKSDLLIVSGTFGEASNDDGKCVLLLNFDNLEGQLQILRLPLTDLDEMFMTEKIIPTRIDKRYVFKYTAKTRDIPTKKEVVKHHDFEWIHTTSEENSARKKVSYSTFSAPIQNFQDPYECYIFMLDNNVFSTKDVEPVVTPAPSNEKSGYEDSCSPSVPKFNDYDEYDSSEIFSTPKAAFSPIVTPKSRFTKGKANGYKPTISSQKPYPLLGFENMTTRRVEEELEKSKVFELIGKFVVLMTSGLTFLFLALFLFGLTPPTCIIDTVNQPPENDCKDKVADNSKDDQEFQNHVTNVFVMMQNVVSFIAGWLQTHCDWRCFLRRYGILGGDQSADK